MTFYPIILEKKTEIGKEVSAMIFRENKLDQICQNNLSAWIRVRIKLEKDGNYFFINSTSGILTSTLGQASNKRHHALWHIIKVLISPGKVCFFLRTVSLFLEYTPVSVPRWNFFPQWEWKFILKSQWGG